MLIYRNMVFLFVFFLFSCSQNEIKKNEKVTSLDTLQSKSGLFIQPDQSTMDISWCPANYPLAQMQGNKQKLIARVIYSRPYKKGRTIFGNSTESLCIYGKPWRLGANEATEITFFENVKIAGKSIEKGIYIMYCIPYETKWTIILNTNLYTWGLNIDTSKNFFSTDIPIKIQSPSIENFTLFFDNTQNGSNMVMAWDNIKTVLPINFVQ